MSQSVVLTGMVLSAMPVGILTKNNDSHKGTRKITAFARGARRPNSQLMAGSNPFSFGEFELFEGKSAYSLSKVTISNYFRELTQDFGSSIHRVLLSGVLRIFCQENNDEKDMLKLLYQSLRALESPAYKNELVRAVFELKAITINGEGPSLVFVYTLSFKGRA